jgi:hypothetical protein
MALMIRLMSRRKLNLSQNCVCPPVISTSRVSSTTRATLTDKEADQGWHEILRGKWMYAESLEERSFAPITLGNDTIRQTLRVSLSRDENCRTYVDQFRLHERIVHVAGRQKDNRESDEYIFVCIVQGVGVVSTA